MKHLIALVSLLVAVPAFAIEEKATAFVLSDNGVIYLAGSNGFFTPVLPMTETIVDTITSMIPKPNSGLSTQSISCMAKSQPLNNHVPGAAVYSIRNCHAVK